jgi:DNA primase
VDPSRVVVATDADRAGRRAAHAAYWRLTAVDADPAVLLLPEGPDPASVLQEEGPDAVRRLIIAAPALADRLVADLLSGQDWSLPGTHGRVTKGAAAILAARPAIEWPAAIERLRERLDLPPGALERLTAEASLERGRDPHRFAREHAALAQQAVRGHGARSMATLAPPITRKPSHSPSTSSGEFELNHAP